MKKLILTLFIFFGLNGCITLDDVKSTNVSKKSDVVSTKKTTLINQTKDTNSNNQKPNNKKEDVKIVKKELKKIEPKVEVEKIAKNKLKKKEIQEENKKEKVKFIQWRCFEHFGSDAKHILTIGYFPQFSEALYQDNTFNKLNHTKKDKEIVKEFLKIFSQSGMEFGMMDLKSTSKQLLAFYRLTGVQHSFMWGGKTFMDYRIKINSSGRGFFYNFEGAKQGESRNSTETFDCKSGYPETVWLVAEDLADYMNNLMRLYPTQN